MICVDIWGKSLPDRGNGKYKGPDAGACHVCGIARRLLCEGGVGCRSLDCSGLCRPWLRILLLNLNEMGSHCSV